MKRWFTHSLVVLAILIASCDFGPINSAVDDFNIVVELEDINTGFSIGVFDSETKDILNNNVTITFDSATALQTIDIFSDPLPEITFDGGFVNVGIRNEIIPTLDNPFYVAATIQVDGYLPQEISFSLSDTGATSYNIDMLSTSNLQGSYVEDEILAPLDDDGNPLPIPIPFDSTTGEILPFASKLIANSNSENVWFPFLNVMNDGSIANVKWNLSNGQSFTGLPAGYVISAYTWNPNTPEFNRGKNRIRSPFGPSDRGFGFRYIYDLLEIKVRGLNTSFSTIESIESLDSNIPHDELAIRMKSLVFTPDRNSNWHDNFGAANSISWFLEEEESGIGVPSLISETDFHFFNWLATDTVLVEILNRNITSGSFDQVLRDLAIGEIGFIKPYLLFPGDPLSHLFFGADIMISNHSLPELNSGLTGDFNVVFYTSTRVSNVEIEVVTTAYVDDGDISIRTDGQTISSTPGVRQNIFEFDEVPKSPAVVTISLGGTTYSEYIDLTNYSGETITITPPPVSPNLITANVKANVRCKSSGSKELNINGFPINNIAIRYREQGVTGTYPQIGAVDSLNYNPNAQVLESVAMQFPGVEVGKTYDFIFSVDAFSETTTEMIQSENFEIDVEVRDSYCQDK